MKKVVCIFVCLVCLCLAGCEALQNQVIDPNSGLNQGVNIAQGVANAAPVIAAAIPAYATIIMAIAGLVSGGYNVYQAVQKSLLKKTAKAMVKAIEQSPSDVAGAIKPMVADNMVAAGIDAKGDQIVQGIIREVKANG